MMVLMTCLGWMSEIFTIWLDPDTSMKTDCPTKRLGYLWSVMASISETSPDDVTVIQRKEDGLIFV